MLKLSHNIYSEISYCISEHQIKRKAGHFQHHFTPLFWAMNVFRLPCFLLCVFAFTSTNADNQINATVAISSWQPFKSDAGNFSIEFPTPPIATITTQESVIGHVTNHIFESKSDISQLSIDYSDLPGFAVSFTGKNTIYTHATGALLKKTLGKLQSSKDLQYQGHTGKHLTYDIPQAPNHIEFDGQSYLFLIGKRLYVINAIAPAGTSTQLVKHFLNSLRFN